MTLNFSSCKILIVGDIMLDKYYFGKVERISPEAPVPIVSVENEDARPGGAANVAHNITKLGGSAWLSGVIGRDLTGREVERLVIANGIHPAFIKTGTPTTTKVRVIGGRQQIVRIDYEQKSVVESADLNRLRKEVLHIIKEVDLLVISDYNKGLFTTEFTQFLILEATKRNIPIVVDPKGIEWQKYRGATIITPNVKELGEILGHPVKNEDKDIEETSLEVLKRYELSKILVTRSEKGMSLISLEERLHIPTQSQEVFDVSGAGDTVVAVLALALASGHSLSEAIILANNAAGVVVRKVGTATLSIDELNAIGNS